MKTDEVTGFYRVAMMAIGIHAGDDNL